MSDNLGIEGGDMFNVLKVEEVEKETELIDYAKEQIRKNVYFPSQQSRVDLIDKIRRANKSDQAFVEEISDSEQYRYSDNRKIFSKENIGHSVHNKSYVIESVDEHIQNEELNILRIYVDVEALKMINDNVGQGRGDKYLLAVYSVLEEVAKDFKERYDKDDELEFYVSAESGDEFGILVVGKEDGKINLGEEYISLNVKSENAEEKSKVSPGAVMAADINERLGEIEGSELLTQQEVIKHIVDEINKYTEKNSNILKNSKRIDDAIFKDLLLSCKDDKEIQALAQEKNISEKNFEELKEKLQEVLRENQIERIEVVAEKFENYKFFASASVGFFALSQGYSDEDQDVIDITEEINKLEKEKKIEDRLDNKAKTNKMLLELLLVKSDKRMKKNKNLFKGQLRNLASMIGTARSNEELDKIIGNLALHSEIFGRTEESAGIQRESIKLQKENTSMKQSFKIIISLKNNKEEMMEERDLLKNDLIAFSDITLEGGELSEGEKEVYRKKKADIAELDKKITAISKVIQDSEKKFD